jgi:hypothetical protein
LFSTPCVSYSADPILQEITTEHNLFIEKFPFYRCDFSVTDGIADSLEEAFEKGPVERIQITNGVIVKDGSKKRYELFSTGEYKPITSEPFQREDGAIIAQNFCTIDERKGLEDEKYIFNLFLSIMKCSKD